MRRCSIFLMIGMLACKTAAPASKVKDTDVSALDEESDVSLVGHPVEAITSATCRYYTNVLTDASGAQVVKVFLNKKNSNFATAFTIPLNQLPLADGASFTYQQQAISFNSGTVTVASNQGGATTEITLVAGPSLTAPVQASVRQRVSFLVRRDFDCRFP